MARKSTYNVQPFRSETEIDDFLFFLRRTKNSKRDVFLFLFGLNTGLREKTTVLRWNSGYCPGIHKRYE